MTYQEEVLFLAKEYVALGWNVIALHSVNEDGSCTCGKVTCTDIGKHPLTPRGVKDSTRDLALVESWFAADGPLRNVGIATGEISNLTVLDIDAGPGKFGDENWVKIAQEHGEVPTLMANTGSGGTHVFFLYNSALKTSSNTIDKNIDCRNDNGYVVAPPSRHRSGGRYSWVNWGHAVAILPAWLTVKKDRRGRPRKDDVYRGKYSLEQVQGMLELIPADDRDLWRAVGIILGREFARADAAWNTYVAWADKWGGVKGRNHDQIMHQAFYEISQQSGERELTIGTIVKAALDNGWVPKKGEVSIKDLVYVVPAHKYLDQSTGAYWLQEAVDAVVSPVNVGGKIVKASTWVTTHAVVTTLARDPTVPSGYHAGVDCIDGVLVPKPGRACFNQYKHATLPLGNATEAGPFVDHVRRLMPKPGDADQFLDYMAHRVQHPGEKPRFALLIAGPMGNGKDTALSFCYPAIGHHNVAPIAPKDVESRFNEYEAATLVVISECADLHEMNKWAFNERLKVLIAGNPDRATVDQKYGVKYSITRFCGVVITTNHLMSGLYIPPGDRRYDVIETATFPEMGLQDEAVRQAYFERLHGWFLQGGDRHVAAFLHERGLSKFSPDHGQRKTAAHASVIAVNLEADGWALDALANLGDPPWVRADWILRRACANGEKEMEVRRKLAPAMDRAGYVKYPNPSRRCGRWYPARGCGVVVYRKVDAPPLSQEDFQELLQRTPF